jgi:hypothetical protein
MEQKRSIVVLMLAMLAGGATADPPVTSPCVAVASPLCQAMPYLSGSGSWIPSTYQWKPNRLPAAVISFRTGNYCVSNGDSNYRGLQAWWYAHDDDPNYDGDGSAVFDNLRDRLNDAYISGYRRIILNLPAGTVKYQDFSGSQWWGMPQWKRVLVQFESDRYQK